MRVIFNEELKQVADDLDRMAQNVRKAIKGAGEALLNQDVEAAQTVIDGDIEIDALESSVIDQCVKLLAKQNPVATDLRVVVSTMRLASTFERMGDLARHVAEAARRTYPAAAIPAIRSTGVRRDDRLPGQHRRPAGGHALRPRCQDRRGHHPRLTTSWTICTTRPSI